MSYNIAKVLKSNIIVKLFEALDDEVLSDADDQPSEFSIEILEKAEELGIGTSNALNYIHGCDKQKE